MCYSCYLNDLEIENARLMWLKYVTTMAVWCLNKWPSCKKLMQSWLDCKHACYYECGPLIYHVTTTVGHGIVLYCLSADSYYS